MLSLMDQCPRLRWCVDADGLTPAARDKLPDWLRCIHNVTDFIVVARAGTALTNPEPLLALSEQVASYPALPWLGFRKAVSRFSDHPLPN
jgi:hypothetical protein